jgi:hypothetical protein
MSNSAPRITATHLRQALATRAGVVVEQQSTGAVYALPQGLTKSQSQDGDLIVLVTNEVAESYVREAAGNYAKAAKTATTILAWEIATIEARLADYAAKAVQL